MEPSEGSQRQAPGKDEAARVGVSIKTTPSSSRPKRRPSKLLVAAGGGLAIVVAALVVVQPGMSSHSSSPRPPAVAASTDPMQLGNPIPSNFEPDFFASQNEVRVKEKEAPLTLDPALTEVAHQRALDMATNHYLAHTSPTGATAVTMLTDANYGAAASAESLARIDQGEHADSTLRAFLGSPPHRASILDPKYTNVGISSVIGDDGKRYLVVIFAG